MSDSMQQLFDQACARYADWGVDVEQAMKRLGQIPISMHCWQGDDIVGFEQAGELGGGLAVTGNYPGKARNADELRSDIEQALSLIPGQHRLNLHAIYAETGGRKIARDELAPEHFSRWIDWARSQKLHGLDFNPTFFAHPLAYDGFTLTSRDRSRREFWIRHGIACRRIGAAIGKAMGQPCVTNVWIPDGYKDTPADRRSPRQLLQVSLDMLFAEPIDPRLNLDCVEGKLFGIGTESYTAGSHEFYFGYALKNEKLVCLDAGHYHPTENMADKISSVLSFLPEILLHVSRGVRWDSDHVIILNDELQAIATEIVRGNYTSRVRIGLDYFDASINRVAAWVIGMRNMVKALLIALLEPTPRLVEMEVAGDFTGRLALMEELKTMPIGAIWDEYCRRQQIPVGMEWLTRLKQYEAVVLSLRK